MAGGEVVLEGVRGDTSARVTVFEIDGRRQRNASAHVEYLTLRVKGPLMSKA